MQRKNIGIDRCKFEVEFKQTNGNEKKVVSIVNKDNFSYGEIFMERGRMVITLCLPKYFDVHNAVPFKMEKTRYFDEIIENVYDAIRKNFDVPFKTELVSIEMNITEEIEGCDYEKVFLLFSHALLDKVKQNARYEIKSDKSIVKPMTSGIKTRLIKGRFLIKAYDKKKQIESEQGISILESPIRIEFVFSKIALVKMFGNKRKMDMIMSKAGLTILTNAYIETMEEVRNDYILPYLEKIHEQMMICMRKTDNIQDVYCEFKEVIYDQEQIRRVLKERYLERGMADNSRSALAKLNKKFALPKGTLKAISEFGKK